MQRAQRRFSSIQMSIEFSCTSQGIFEQDLREAIGELVRDGSSLASSQYYNRDATGNIVGLNEY